MQKKLLLIMSMLSAQVLWSAAKVTLGLPDPSTTPSIGYFASIVRGLVHHRENDCRPEGCKDFIEKQRAKIIARYPDSRSDVRVAAMNTTNALRRHLEARYALGKAFSDDIFATDRWMTLIDDADIEVATQMRFYHTVIPFLTKNIALKLEQIEHLVERCDGCLDDGKRNTDAQIVAWYNDTGCEIQQMTDEMEKLRNAALILKDLAYRTVSSR